MWRVTFTAPLPAHARAFDIVSLRGWDNAGLQVHDSRFFGGIDGVHCKSNGALFANNAMACTGFDVSPWQHYLEGPAPPKPKQCRLFGVLLLAARILSPLGNSTGRSIVAVRALLKVL